MPSIEGRIRKRLVFLLESAGSSTHAGGFAVELPVFTGPFRLLADLILEQKVDVCDVSVASITDRYLAHAEDPQRWNLEEVPRDLRGDAGAQGLPPHPEALGAR